VEFGVFDHLDRGASPLREYYEERLRIIEVFDRAGFFGYHAAEHHATPLGMAPSPSVFLAAVAQRTQRLRFGPMVYALPLYHPFRLVEEICMLDQMSGGRLEIGFGRGASPIETAFFGQDHAQAQRMYAEGLDLVLKALTEGKLDFQGEFYSFKDVPLCVEPLQKPYPPMWYGAHSPDSSERAARRGHQIVSLDTPAETRTFADRFRPAWRETWGAAKGEPKVGLGLFIVVAETDRAALELARPAYRKWHDSFNYLFRLKGTIPSHPRPAEFDTISAAGRAIAGSPETVTRWLRSRLAEAGANYLVGQLAFGDLPFADTMRSIELFAGRVMPELKKAATGRYGTIPD
jgi:alkanesulfonate monooxygenase SsuD/methylene tetrahydromethanopterin reductase-like flavin-dependent oxidoreductase (luciferase family)